MITAEDLRHLPIEQKVQLASGLWEQIANSGRTFPISEEDLTEAHRRLEEMRRDPSIGLTEEEMWRSVDRKLAARRD